MTAHAVDRTERMPLTVVIAPDSFKGSASARQVADAIAHGWAEIRPTDTLVLLPQADGGEGTIDALESAIPGSLRRSAGIVVGPDGGSVDGEWLDLPDGIAALELAASSGLTLLRTLDPMGSTTVGLGQVIAAALDAGAAGLVIGLGGSASTDGGAGALSALGLQLLDAAGDPLPLGGGALVRLDRLDRSALRAMPSGGVRLLTDVDAPLLGRSGAATVFGPQKGADPAQIATLEAGLTEFALALGGDRDAPGCGAAGGTGFGFATALGASLESGADTVAALTGLTEALETADVVITGEGAFDATSFSGKVVGRMLDRVASMTVRRDIRTVVVAGSIADEVSRSDRRGQRVRHGEVELHSLSDIAGSAHIAIADPLPALREAGRRAARRMRGRPRPTQRFGEDARSSQ